ncbi:MAG: flagellar hook assembly protein FlgD [Synergistaceae bacterium]|jgi:flagellar basal-body rod modification protein FlgD|nr:flagellar hook assembly protein FlgD [Synergistaceae bacterium]
MAVNSVTDPTGGLSSSQLEAASRSVSQELDKDAFLRLLIAELSNQDPLNPMDDREFISQMAEFSSLEQMTNMTKALEGLASTQEQYSAVSYIGKTVFFPYQDAEGNTISAYDKVIAVWYDATQGTILQTTYGEIALKNIEGVMNESPDSL